MGTNVESRLSEMLPAQLGELSILERKVSTYLLKHEDKLMSMDISEIAKAAGVSKSTVVRFCKALGFNGLKDFKIYYEAGKSQYATKLTKLSKGVSSEKIMDTMKNGYIRAIEKSCNEDNLKALDGICSDLKSKEKVYVLYSENKGIAQSLVDRLNTIGYKADLCPVQEGITRGLVGQVTFIISFSGELDGLASYFRLVRQFNGKIEAVTCAPKSWLGVNSDNTLSIFNEKLIVEDKYIFSNFAADALFETLYSMLVIDSKEE